MVEKTDLKDEINFEPPDYVLPANREKFFALCRDIGIFDQERTIFENILEFVQNHKLNPVVNYSEFTSYLQKKSLPGLTIDVNIDTYSKKLINFLAKHNLCKIIKGDSENPATFILTDPYTNFTELEEKNIQTELTDEIKKIIFDVYDNINVTEKLDIPFPTIESIQEAAKNNPNLKEANLNTIWQNSLTTIRVDDFNPAFIEKSKTFSGIIKIIFDEENHILLTPECEEGLFQSVLTKKIMQYVLNNPDIQDRIRVVLKKNQKEVPDINIIFQDISTDAAFFWILTFKRIMEYLYQHKKNNETYLHYYEAASLLYQYALSKREEHHKEDLENQKHETFKNELLREMILNFSEPWTYEKIVNWHNSLKSPILSEGVTREIVSKFIEEVNKNPLVEEGIPPVIVIHTKEEIYFVHKYRFAQFFLIQCEKESKRLTNIYIERWATNPQHFDTDMAFDIDIRDNLSDLFYHLIFRTIPMIFGFPNTSQRLFPDIVTIKNLKLQDTDLSDPAKHKTIFEALVTTIFSEKNKAEIKPLHLILSLNQKTLHKLAREYAFRHIPFYKRGIIGFLFGWLFELLERLSVTEEIRFTVENAKTIEELNVILEKYKNSKAFYSIKKIVEKRRQELIKEQQMFSAKDRDKKIQEEIEARQKRAQKIAALKSHYLKGETIEKRLEELSKQWNTKIGKAREETENNVVHAVMVIMNRIKHFKLTVEEIETLAERVTQDPAFKEITNKKALKDYIALIIFNRLIQRVG